MTRIRRVVIALVAAGACLAVPVAAALAVVDTTPPVGTLTVEGGIGYSADTTLALDVPATDDVGVVTLRARLVGGEWTDFAYAPKINYTFGDKANFSQQQLTVEVEWLDAAGNSSTAQQTFWLDWAAPDLQQFQTTTDQGAPGTVTFYVGAYEEASGVAAVRFSSNGGTTWGAEIPMTDQIVIWDPRNTKYGGRPDAFGTFTVKAKVRDGSGQWSNVRSTSVTVTSTLSIGVSPNPTTGHPITFTAKWDPDVTVPTSASCLWEFMTGDDQSLYYGNRDGSFSFIETYGSAASGYCDHWTFTLPWSTVRQYLVHLRVTTSVDTLGDAWIGSSPSGPNINVAVGSTSRQIESSSLPMFYVLPDAYELTVGVPATYHGYALGGASIRSTDQWVIEYENVPEVHPGSAELTFTPKKTGHLTVCLYRRGSATDPLGACYDPPVHRGSGSGSGGGSSGSSGSAPPAAGSPSPGPTAPASAAPSETVGASLVVGVAATDSPTIPPTADPGPVAGTGGPASGGDGSPLLLVAFVVIGGAAGLLMRPRFRARLGRGGPPTS